MKPIYLLLFILAFSAPQVMAQNDPLTGAPCPIGGDPLVGNLIHDQRSGTGGINSNSGYVPTTPFAPFIQPSPPPVVAPNFAPIITSPLTAPNSGYNNFGNNNYSSPYGYNNGAAAGAGLAVIGVAGFKVSKSIFHKLASSNHGNHQQKKPQITKLDNGDISVDGAEYTPVTELNKPAISTH